MWTLPDSELPAFVSATVNASAFWPNHKFCHCADCFFSHPVSVAASCLTALYYDRVRGSPRCCSDRPSARGSPTYEPGPAQDFCLLQERLSLQILLVGGSKPRFDLLLKLSPKVPYFKGKAVPRAEMNDCWCSFLQWVTLQKSRHVLYSRLVGYRRRQPTDRLSRTSAGFTNHHW